MSPILSSLFSRHHSVLICPSISINLSSLVTVLGQRTVTMREEERRGTKRTE